MIQFYLNKNLESSSCCLIGNNLSKDNYLSEFSTDAEKEAVRDNLGISDIIKDLNNKIDKKVFKEGDYIVDNTPTEGHINRIVNSDGIYKFIVNNFASKQWLEEDLNRLNERIMAFLERYNQSSLRRDNDINDSITSLQEFIESNISNINSLIEAIREGTEQGGLSISNKFGDSETIGISLKTLTDTINRIWSKLGEVTGEDYQGITFTVTPDFFSGNTCNVHVIASTEDSSGVFESLKLYLNGELIIERENIESFTYDIQISETSILTCKVKMLGVEYTKTKTITKYTSFWIGTGAFLADPSSIMVSSNIKPLNENFKGNFNITFEEGEHLIIIMGEDLRLNFFRADMNGVEIPFYETTTLIDGNTYSLFTSLHGYKRGSYNIDINS